MNAQLLYLGSMNDLPYCKQHTINWWALDTLFTITEIYCCCHLGIIPLRMCFVMLLFLYQQLYLVPHVIGTLDVGNICSKLASCFLVSTKYQGQWKVLLLTLMEENECSYLCNKHISWLKKSFRMFKSKILTRWVQK